MLLSDSDITTDQQSQLVMGRIAWTLSESRIVVCCLRIAARRRIVLIVMGTLPAEGSSCTGIRVHK
jgi:hypothetical protein